MIISAGQNGYDGAGDRRRQDDDRLGGSRVLLNDDTSTLMAAARRVLAHEAHTLSTRSRGGAERRSSGS